MIKRKVLFTFSLLLLLITTFIIVTGIHTQADAILATNQVSDNFIMSNVGINTANGSGVLRALTGYANFVSIFGIMFSFISKKKKESKNV